MFVKPPPPPVGEPGESRPALTDQTDAEMDDGQQTPCASAALGTGDDPEIAQGACGNAKSH